ncbi:MAG: ABC transporter ATP-binding protein/permease, partial [Lachnospiraceae bacterium]|nr:ABC transporter ATP-binding protein/permease [Lachnospiraceae bacterium]
VVAELLIPYFMGWIIDRGIYNPDESLRMHNIVLYGGLMIGMAFIGLFGGMLGGRLGAKASTGLARNLRETMYNTIQTFSFSNIDKFSASGLVTRMTTDITNIQQAYQMMLRITVRAPLTMIIALILAFRINSRIAMIYLIALGILAVVMITIMMTAMPFFRQAFPKYDALNESVQENVSAIRVVKAYVREKQETEKFHNASNAIYKIFTKAEGRVAYNWPILSLIAYTCIIIISWRGAKMIVNGVDGMTTGQLASLLSYCMSILFSMMMVAMVFVMLSMSFASMERVAEVLNETPDITNPENPCMEVADGSIVFKDVEFSYHKEGGEPVLKDIDLEIKSGETIGIMGATGSAKSSLVNLISRLYDVDEGEVIVGGKNVKEYDLEVLRNQVSVVLQKNVLFSGSIYDNLRWGNKEATDEECREACRLACADDFISSFPDGYDTHIEQGGTNVSGGQKQRLCIARALLKKPKILILDDSTSAVDTATDAKIKKAFKEAIPGTTKIIIAQRISSIQEADRIIVLDDGKVNAFDTHENLVANNDIYREVYESQTGGSGDFDETEVG